MTSTPSSSDRAAIDAAQFPMWAHLPIRPVDPQGPDNLDYQKAARIIGDLTAEHRETRR